MRLEGRKNVLIGILGGALGMMLVIQVLPGLTTDAVAAPRPETQQVREQNLDAGGLIRVHEQGTVSVAGTVAVSNLPVDGSGNVKVAGSPAPRGRTVVLAENVTLASGSRFTTPLVDTSDCRSIGFLLDAPRFVDTPLATDMLMSADGIHVHGRGDAAANAWGEGAAIRTFVTSPYSALHLQNNYGTEVTLNTVWLYCAP